MERLVELMARFLISLLEGALIGKASCNNGLAFFELLIRILLVGLVVAGDSHGSSGLHFSAISDLDMGLLLRVESLRLAE